MEFSVLTCVRRASSPRVPPARSRHCLAMRREEADYPAQSAGTYLQRVLKYTLLLALTTPLLYGVIVYALGLVGVDHDKV